MSVLYKNDFSGSGEPPNRWKKTYDAYNNGFFDDAGTYGRLYRSGGANSVSAIWRCEEGLTWEDYESQFTCQVNFHSSLTLAWYVRVSDLDSIKIKHDYAGGTNWRLTIDAGGTPQPVFTPQFNINDVIKTKVSNTGTDIIVTVWRNDVVIANATIDGSVRTSLSKGTIAFGCVSWQFEMRINDILVEDDKPEVGGWRGRRDFALGENHEF